MGALLPVCVAAVAGGVRDRREFGCAVAVMGHVTAAGCKTARVAMDGSGLCEHLPGRATRSRVGRAGTASLDDARLGRHGRGVSDLLLFSDLCAAPRIYRLRSMGRPTPLGVRAGPAVAGAALVSRDLGVADCDGNRWMAGTRLGTAGVLELRDHGDAHRGGRGGGSRGSAVGDARAPGLGAAAGGGRARGQFLVRVAAGSDSHHQPRSLWGSGRLYGGRHCRQPDGATARGHAGGDVDSGACWGGPLGAVGGGLTAAAAAVRVLWRAVCGDGRLAAEFSPDVDHGPASEEEAWSYNVLQRLTYLLVIFVLFPLVIWTGLAMSPAIASAFPAAVAVLG